MSDDIVTRLREHYADNAAKWDLLAAAEEIERLRAYVLSFPCSCWVNKPKCVRCQVQAHVG